MSAQSRRFQSFEEFWPFYVGEHRMKATRALHFLGTSLATVLAISGAITHHHWILVLVPFAGYGPAWASHFFVEKNRPASFKYPAWSLLADFVMWQKIATGSMGAEVARLIEGERDTIR